LLLELALGGKLPIELPYPMAKVAVSSAMATP
jgi:hypothetical protein